jgi:hypothetical protein
MKIMRFELIALAVTLATSALGCQASAVFYNPDTDPNYGSYSPCGYDPYYGYYCMSEDGTAYVSKDVTTTIAQDESAKLEVAARHFSREFQLSDDQGMKIAKTVHDYNALKTRSDRDVADFARRLYGIEPNRIVKAVGQAQMGNSAALDEVVTEAAKNFNTTQDNMRRIVKSLHGKLIQEQGIAF